MAKNEGLFCYKLEKPEGCGACSSSYHDFVDENLTAGEYVELEQFSGFAHFEVEREEDVLEDLVRGELKLDEHQLARVDGAVSQVDLKYEFPDSYMYVYNILLSFVCLHSPCE